uniref:Ribonuclease H-like domain-containing protein n=1 Tax=Tanacetum cinerariifolium TaxID=118510 RepID=A0A699I3T4_TANCI|nr:ribonuclease H-like domain-containing protein [Tanacetum cinerariifolium]
MSSPRAVAFTTGPSSVAGPLANLAPPFSYYYAGPTLLPAAYSHLVAQPAYSMAQPNLVAPIAHPTVHDNNCTIEFDAFGFSVKDFLTRRVLLRYDSTRDLYPVTALSPTPHAFLVSQHMWHQRLGHPRGEVLRRLVSPNFISCNKEKPPSLCHACQLGKHVRLPFVSSGTIRTVLSLASFRHWPIHQLNVKNAFLHRDLSETVYMLQPSGFQDYAHLDYRIIGSLHKEFAMTDLGPLNYFLVISVTRNPSGLFLSQKKYAIEILEKAHMVSCNPSQTPVDTESKLGVDGDPVCLHMHDHREPHLSAFKRILRYIQGTLNYGLQLFSSSTIDLVAYSDVDWAGCPTTRRSTSEYCIFLGNNLLSWSAKRQPMLSQSSAEADYRGVANAVGETCWLRNLLRELHTPLSSATLVRVLHVLSQKGYVQHYLKSFDPV